MINSVTLCSLPVSAKPYYPCLPNKLKIGSLSVSGSACIKHRIHFTARSKLIAYSRARGKAGLFVLLVLSFHSILRDHKCIWYVVDDQYVNGSSVMIHAGQAAYQRAPSPAFKPQPACSFQTVCPREAYSVSTLPFETGSPTGLELTDKVKLEAQGWLVSTRIYVLLPP